MGKSKMNEFCGTCLVMYFGPSGNQGLMQALELSAVSKLLAKSSGCRVTLCTVPRYVSIRTIDRYICILTCLIRNNYKEKYIFAS